MSQLYLPGIRKAFCLIREEVNSVFLRNAEACSLHRQDVGRGPKGGDDVKALGISNGGAREGRALLGRNDSRGSNRRPARIGNPACNAAEALRVRKQGREQKGKKNYHHILLHFCFPFRGLPVTFVSAMPVCRGVPGALTTRQRLSHHELKATQHSLRTITLLDSRNQLLE